MEDWQARIRSYGFADFTLTPLPDYALWKQEVERRGQTLRLRLPDVRAESVCALVLYYPYQLYENLPQSTPLISAYYPASNRAYHQAEALCAALQKAGLPCMHDAQLPYKPTAQNGGLTAYGYNCLQHHPVFGSLFALELLHLCCSLEEASAFLHLSPVQLPENGGEALPASDAEPQYLSRCSACRNCVNSCPMQALHDGTMTYTRCLRWHMLRKVDETEIREKMGLRLLGCDTCNENCLQNRSVPRQPYPDAYKTLFSFANLLQEERLREALPDMTQIIGANYARAYPLLRQAALIAGNSGDKSLLPDLHILCAHPDPAVCLHATWSVNRLRTQE